MTDRSSKAERHARVALARQRIGEIEIDYSPQTDLKDALDELRYTALATRGRPQRGVHLFGPSYAGKTSAVLQHARDVTALGEHSQGAVPIAVATIDPDGSLASVATDILRALRAPRPDLGSTALRWERVWNSIPEHDVQILVLDEFQRAGRRPSVSPVIAAKIQDIMEAGLCAVAFLGLETADQILRSAHDLQNRLDVPVTMPALHWTCEDDRELFRQFVARYDDALVASGVTPVRSGLADSSVQLQLLMEASNGLIGQFARIIETAALMVVREQLPCISRQELHDAVEDWAIPNRRIACNPFRDAQ